MTNQANLSQLKLSRTLTKLIKIGSSGVRALPVAAGLNEGGHYFWYFFSFLLLTAVAKTP